MNMLITLFLIGISTVQACDLNHFTCTNGNFIPINYHCDGCNDCGDWSDERPSMCTWDQNHFTCASGNCIPINFHCDGDNDCGDWSDEQPSMCSTSTSRPTDKKTESYNDICRLVGFVKCKNKLRCISPQSKCDGYDDCGDNSDEENCHHSRSTCDQNHFTCTSGNCIPINYHCDGDNDCGDWSDERQSMCKCLSSQFTCNNHKCLPSSFTCDGTDDCGDNSDETSSQCGTSAVRGGVIAVICTVVVALFILILICIRAKMNVRRRGRQTRSNLRTVSGNLSRNTRRRDGSGIVIIGRAYSEDSFPTELDNAGFSAPPPYSALVFNEPPPDYFSVVNSQDFQVQTVSNRDEHSSANSILRDTVNQTIDSNENSTSSSTLGLLGQTNVTVNENFVGSSGSPAQVSESRSIENASEIPTASSNTLPIEQNNATCHSTLHNRDVNSDEIVLTVRNIDNTSISLANDHHGDSDVDTSA